MTDIVAYTFDGDIYCADCAEKIMAQTGAKYDNDLGGIFTPDYRVFSEVADDDSILLDHWHCGVCRNEIEGAPWSKADIEDAAKAFVDDCLAELESAEVVNLEHISPGAEGFSEVAYMGRAWNINPSGTYGFGPSIDEWFWETVDSLSLEHDISVEGGEGDPTDTFVYRYLADTWNELTPEQQDRFVDYS